MVRTIIQLTEVQAKGLRELAKEQGVSVAELVRRGVDTVLRSGVSDAKVRKRAKQAVGFISDVGDVSANHDKYLAEIYANEISE